jgi:ferredoxin
MPPTQQLDGPTALCRTCGVCTAQCPVNQLLYELVVTLQTHKLDGAGDVLQPLNDERKSCSAVAHATQDVHLQAQHNAT